LFYDCETVQEVRNLYKSLCLQYHPDKGGNAEIFKSICSTYQRALFHLDDESDEEPEVVLAVEPQPQPSPKQIVDTYLENKVKEMLALYKPVTPETAAHYIASV
jgi:hypothetical protein